VIRFKIGTFLSIKFACSISPKEIVLIKGIRVKYTNKYSRLPMIRENKSGKFAKVRIRIGNIVDSAETVYIFNRADMSNLIPIFLVA